MKPLPLFFLLIITSVNESFAEEKASPPPLKPYVLIPKTATPPSVNTGKPTGGAWDKAVWVSNPVYLNAKEITPKFKMRVGLLWDDTALYVGFEIEGFRQPVAITQTQGDDGLERDDAVEVTLKVPGFATAKDQPVQFKLNCVGQRDDAIHFDFKWNAKWEGAVDTAEKNWSATFKIPFENFGVKPKEGNQWPANFGAYLQGYDYRAFLWSPVNVGHHHGGDFGTIEFGPINVPANAIGRVKVERSNISVYGTTQSPGRARLLLLSPDGGQNKEVMRGNVIASFDEEGKTALLSKVVEIPSTGAWTASLDNVRAGSYLLKTILMDAGDRKLNVDVKPVKVTRSLEIRVLPYPVARSASAIVTVHNLNKEGAKPDRLKLVVQDGQGRKIQEVQESLKEVLPSEKLVCLGQLKNGTTYRVIASAGSADGENAAEDTAEFTLPPRPSWADTDAGRLKGKVPKPWTPITAKNHALSCWGRTYDFKDNFLPAAISSSGHPILADRIRLLLAGDGELAPLDKSLKPARFNVSKTGDEAQFRSDADAPAAHVEVQGRLEFDGFMFVDLGIQPKVPLRQFSVEIPLDNNLARYIQPLPGAKNRDRTGAIPDSGFSQDPSHSVWICSDQVGFYFGCASTQNWKAPPGKALEVIRRGKDTLLRINFHQDGNPFKEPRRYQFYLQTTPVRPQNADWFGKGLRMANGLTWGQTTTALEPDAVKTIALESLSPDAGVIELVLQNRSDLEAITRQGNEHHNFTEKIAELSGEGGALALAYLSSCGGINLKTPWGELGNHGNAAWKSGGTHKLAITWGDKLRLLVDGKPQGELNVKGFPLKNAKLVLGSVSARYNLQAVRISKEVDSQALAENGEFKETGGSLSAVKGPLDLQSNARTPLHAYRDLGGKSLIFFEHWCHAESGGQSKYEAELKPLVEDVHRLGLKVIFYFGFQIAELPEFADILEECKDDINRSADYYAPQRQNAYQVSYGSPYQEYLIHHMQRLKKEMGIDGVYLDGTFNVIPSDNPAFGCGYVDENGNRIPTIPIDRIRLVAKRINNLFVQDGGTVYAHLGNDIPTIGFASNTYLGEHIGFLNTDWKHVTDLIPLDVSRAIYAWNNTGVPKVLCQQLMWPHLRKTHPQWFVRNECWADLHGVGTNILIEDPICEEGQLLMKKNRLMDEFGADRAEWIPYWETEKTLKCNPPEWKVSAYRRKDGAMVCAIGNLTNQDAKGSVDFNSCPALQLKGERKAVDLLTGTPCPIEGGRITVTLPAGQRILLKVE